MITTVFDVMSHGNRIIKFAHAAEAFDIRHNPDIMQV